VSGSVSSYYYAGKSQIEILTPPPPGELTFNRETLSTVDQKSVISSATIMFIIANAGVFAWLIDRAGVPEQIGLWLRATLESPELFLLGVNAALWAELGLQACDRVRVRQGGASAVLPVRVEPTLAWGCARVSAGHADTATLGAMGGSLTLERVPAPVPAEAAAGVPA
jgi:hypothetical protein